ncbi:circularly permuted type 2 ATP-grasp protein [Megalodesulfovibrio gigas]|nr:circularly permuted type 2 ATP-grasp protein [Megalodesulfovibrio gigas]
MYWVKAMDAMEHAVMQPAPAAPAPPLPPGVDRLLALDELRAPDGSLHPHWSAFLASLERMGPDEVGRRRLDIRRLLRENGVTFHVHGDPSGRHRPWELDLVPWVIAPADWEQLEAGLTQRAMVLDLLFKDLYGPRMLLRERVVPAEAVFSHPGFLRTCDKMHHRGERQLVFHSADCCRDPDGRFRVLRDFTQSPTGSGYALENRTVLARVLPDVFRDCNVERISHFFRAMRDTLARLAPRRRDDPRIVLLTPGPEHETYFEHAYLAAYLGYTLVQGEDLTVRDGAVWLKSIGGLEPVDVILRRVTDVLCDPLELQEDSRHGVAGLVEAVRLQHVAVANPLGSGVLENPGLAACLDRVCRRLLGEDLLLPGPRTWWCGTAEDKRYIFEHLDSLKILPIAPQHGAPVDGWRLSRAERQALQRRMAAAPFLFAAQEPLEPSAAPSLPETEHAPLLSRPVVVRTFLTAKDDGYMVMPGGLTRSVGNEHGAADEPLQELSQELSKDTWVRARARAQHVSLWTSSDVVREPWAVDNVLPSLAAENLFWVGRYLERATACARLLRVLANLFNHSDTLGPETERECLPHLLQALANLTGGPLPASPEELSQWSEQELRALALDPQLGGSLSRTLRLLASNAYAVRDRWSADTWRVIDAIQEHAEALAGYSPLQEHAGMERLQAILDLLLTSLIAFTGYTMESMTRAVGWVLLDTGRRMERGLMLIGMLQGALAPHTPQQLSESVAQQLMEMTLSTLESLITYRRRYRSQLRLEQTLDLLLLDETNPRSLAFQLEQLRSHMQALPRPRRSSRTSPEERLALEAYASLKRMDALELARYSTRTRRHEVLHTFLADQFRLLAAMSDAISLSFFSHAGGPTPLARRRATTL